MYEKNVKNFTVARFGGNFEMNDAFSTADCACIFLECKVGLPKNLVNLMCDLLHYLKNECCSLKILTFDLIQQGLWPLLNIILRIPNQTLFGATIGLCSELLHQNCFAISPREQNKVVSAIFASLKISSLKSCSGNYLSFLK